MHFLYREHEVRSLFRLAGAITVKRTSIAFLDLNKCSFLNLRVSLKHKVWGVHAFRGSRGCRFLLPFPDSLDCLRSLLRVGLFELMPKSIEVCVFDDWLQNLSVGWRVEIVGGGEPLRI
jgi:hypothetical protein